MKTATAPHKISVDEACQNAGIDTESYDDLMDSIVPACCSEGCMVEPDGRCEHGFPSVLLAMGVI